MTADTPEDIGSTAPAVVADAPPAPSSAPQDCFAPLAMTEGVPAMTEGAPAVADAPEQSRRALRQQKRAARQAANAQHTDSEPENQDAADMAAYDEYLQQQSTADMAGENPSTPEASPPAAPENLPESALENPPAPAAPPANPPENPASAGTGAPEHLPANPPESALENPPALPAPTGNAAASAPAKSVPIARLNKQLNHQAPADDAANAAWLELVARLDLRGLALEIIHNSVLLHRDKNLVQMALRQSSSALINSQTSEHLAQIATSLSDYLASDVAVELGIGVEGGQTYAERHANLYSERHQMAISSIMHDPVIQELQTRFAATVNPQYIKPLEPQDERSTR